MMACSSRTLGPALAGPISLLGLLAASCSSFGATDSIDAGQSDASTREDAAGEAGQSDAGIKRIFLTKSEYAGDLVSAARATGHYAGDSGLLAADALCDLEAEGLPAGRWRAWISVGGSSPLGAIGRFTDTKSPRVSVKTGEIVLQRIGGDLAMLVQDSDGKLNRDARRVWTGTTPQGTVAAEFNGAPSDCQGWTLGSGIQVRGAAGDPNDLAGWSDKYGGEYCSVRGRLYCVED